MGRKKQDIRLGGRPLLRWTLDVFEGVPEVAGVVVAVPAEDVAAWRRRLAGCRKVRAVVAGGRERQESVARGLAAVPPTAAWILVHDGPSVHHARPVHRVVDAGALGRRRRAARRRDAEAWPRGVVQETTPRDGIWAVQTPQGFRAGLLREALRRATADGVVGTDDAALVERLGLPVGLVPGLPGNVKVTRPEDLPLARQLLTRPGRRTRSARSRARRRR
jgi:2-C-methyl-D-erythritol 4-phosphate cytidylyltransferase